MDAFGNPLPSSAASATVPENPFVYHGGLGYWSEPELGLTYVRQRWLDTASGQWLSVDPIEGEPRYSYAYNSPTRFVDPDGTDPPNPLKQAITFLVDRYRNFYGGLLDRGQRALYTGDPYASDEVYSAAKDQAVQTLEDGLHTISAKKQAWLDEAQRAVVAWTEAQSKNYESSFSTIQSNLKHNPFIRWIPPALLRELEKKFGGGYARRYQNTRANLPMFERIFVPPYPGTRAEFQYKVGFLWGIAVTLVDTLDLVSQVSGILEALLVFVKTEPNFWAFLFNAAKQYVVELTNKSANPKLSVFQQGKMAAIVLLNVITLILLAVSIGKAAGKLGGAIKKAAERLAKQTEKSANVLAAATEIQARTSQEVIEGRIKRQLRDSLDVPRVPKRLFLNKSRQYAIEYWLKSRDGTVVNLKGEQPRMLSVAVDVTTGKPYYGVSGNAGRRAVHPFMRERAKFDKVETWEVDNCAEFDAINNALLAAEAEGRRPDCRNLEVFTVRNRPTRSGGNIVRPSGIAEPRCRNCRRSTRGVSVLSELPNGGQLPLIRRRGR